MVRSRLCQRSFFNCLQYRARVIPVAFILLPSKSPEIYQKMTKEILEIVPAWQPHTVIMDFEKGTINAFKHTFPTVELTACYFHFSQNILRFLQL